MSDLDVVSSSTDLVSSVYDSPNHTAVPDSSTGLVVVDEGITSIDPDSLSVSLAPSLANPTIQGLLSSPVNLTNAQLIGHPEGIQIITLNNPNELLSTTNPDSSRWQLATIITVGDEQIEEEKADFTVLEETSSTELIQPTDDGILMPPPAPPTAVPLPPDAPEWAKRIKCCEKIGDYYRGYVESDMDLDLLLTFHKQQTQSLWGTRQSPSPAKPSTRLMWKSQYVPMDGIPFVNTGSRAVVMECQYGPRRKGNPLKKQTNSSGDYKLTCPARIYVKRVKKFPEYAVDLTQDKKNLKMEMDRAFHELKQNGFNGIGQERYYVQLPTEKAHEFHEMTPITPVAQVPVESEAEAELQTHRLDPRVAQKIRDIVAGGETRVYAVRKQLRTFVTRDLYHGGNIPERHDLTLFPTVNDLKNHIHQALKDVENGTLPLTAPTVNVEIIGNDNSHGSDIDQSLWLQQGGGSDGSEPVPETVTVTLTQTPGEEGHHVISRIETHLSDGTTRVSTTLTPETAQLLSRLHPNMFPAGSLLQQQIDQAVTSISQKILVEPKTDTSNEISTDENINFSTVDNFMPSFSTTDSLVTNFNSVSNLTIDALSSENSINSQYTIDTLAQNINSDNLEQGMDTQERNHISSVISSSDNMENSENCESTSESDVNKTDLPESVKSEDSNSQLHIEPLPSDSSGNQIADNSSEVTPLEMNSLSGDMTGIIQIPYSANGLQIIPISGNGTNLFNFSTSSGYSYPIQIGQISSDNTLTYSSPDGAVSDMQIDSSQSVGDMQIDSSQSVGDMNITFANEDVDSSQLEQFSLKMCNQMK